MSIKTALREINNAVLDLQSADYNTFERPLERLAAALDNPDIRDITQRVRSTADLEELISNADQAGSMLGSARLKWPAERDKELGLVVQIFERSAADPDWFLGFAHTYYYSGRKIVGDIRKITTSVIIPFNRDFAALVEDLSPAMPDEEKVSGVTYNIGTMHNSPMQHISAGGQGTQTVTYSLEDLYSIVSVYSRNVDSLISMKRSGVVLTHRSQPLKLSLSMSQTPLLSKLPENR